MALLLVNASAAGGRAPARLRRLLEAARRAGEDGLPEPVVTTCADEARARLAGLSPGERVVVAGGDGTVHALLPVLAERRLELAVLPLGSGNDVARATGLHGRATAADLVHALRAPARPADLLGVRLDGQPEQLAVSSVAIGFDAAVGQRATRSPAVVGSARYLLATLAELRHLHLWSLSVTLDGLPLAGGDGTLFASVLNTPTYGGGLPVVPAARLDDGRLDLVVAGRFTRLQALGMLPLLQAGRHLGHPRVDCRSGRRAVVDAPVAAVPVALDGEAQTPARAIEVTLRPQALALVRVDGARRRH